MGRVTATKAQKQQLRRWYSSQRPAPTLREAEKDLLTTVLAYHLALMEENDESRVTEAENIVPIAIPPARDARKG
jgi:hypothetical protein